MRKPIIAGNWKMNKTIDETMKLVDNLRESLRAISDIDIVLFPPFTSLFIAGEILRDTNIKLGAQNVFYEEKGAYTGEVSPLQIKDVGAEYVIIGHSERRNIIGENDEIINKKVMKAIKNNLSPIICVGETLKEREENRTQSVVISQLKAALQGVDEGCIKKVIVAYEPIWAIGTGKNSTGVDAQETCKALRECLSNIYTPTIGQNIRIQYGGSVTSSNIAEFAKECDIDGALVGGASQDVESFSRIVKLWREVFASQ